jgi:hypothetical protein
VEAAVGEVEVAEGAVEEAEEAAVVVVAGPRRRSAGRLD